MSHHVGIAEPESSARAARTLITAKSLALASGMVLLVTILTPAGPGTGFPDVVYEPCPLPSESASSEPGEAIFHSDSVSGACCLAFKLLHFSITWGRSFLTGQLGREGRNEVTPGPKESLSKSGHLCGQRLEAIAGSTGQDCRGQGEPLTTASPSSPHQFTGHLSSLD